MSDIHGNSRRFNSIMEQINLQDTDTLYILGDVVDRYPDGIKILRKLMCRSNVKMLIGNHEYMMLNALDNDALDDYEKDNAYRLWYNNGGWVTHSYLKHIKKTIRREVFDYLRSLPYNIDVEVNGIKYKLVHGSPMENYVRSRDYDSESEFAVWERWSPCDHIPEGYTLILGHTPTVHFQNDNPLKIWLGKNAIAIDCGSGYGANSGYYYAIGRLACLRLDDMKVFYSKEEGVNDEQ